MMLLDLPEVKPHPAKYTDSLLPVMAEMLQPINKPSSRILDPFGGTGKIFQLRKYGIQADISAVEIEPEWANYDERITLGDALDLPFDDNHFSAICTSPTYGNRMADTYLPDNSPHHYNTYTYQIGRQLAENNSGSLQWGDEYRAFHEAAWMEATRVLTVGGLFVLNIKDHIRKGQRQHVTAWHIETLQMLGFDMLREEKIDCTGNREGENGTSRIDYESVILFRLKTKDFATKND